MFKKILKILLVFLLLIIVGLPVVLGVVLGITLNNDAAFKQVANLILKRNDVGITQLLNVEISLTQLSLSFEKIEFEYQNNIARLEGLNIYLSGFENKRPYHDVNINKVSLILSDDGDDDENLALDLLDYLPSNIIKNYSGVDVWIGELSLEHPYLKRPIVIKDIDLSNSHNNLTLGMSPELLIYKPEVFLTLNTENKITANVIFSKSDFITLHLTTNEIISEKSGTTPDGIHIKAELDLQLSDKIKEVINEYFVYGNTIDSIQSSIHLSGETTIPSRISALEEIYPSLLSGSLNATINTDLKFNEQLIRSVKIDLNFITKPTTLENPANKKENSRTVQFLKNNTIKTKLNARHELLKNNQSTEFLAARELQLNISPRTQLHFIDKTFTLGKGLTFRWAKTSDPAFLHWELNALNGNYESKETFKGALSYHLNGRFNRFFATQHDANIKVQSINSLLKAEATIVDQDLQSQFDLSLEKNNETIKSKYHYQLSKLNKNSNKRENKKINKMISYWDEDLTLLSGSADLRGDLSADLNNMQISNVIYHFNIDIKDFDLDYDGFIFSKLNSKINFSGKNNHITNNKPSLITIEQIDAGLILKNITLSALYDYHLDKDSTVYFSNLQAQTLGGILSSQELTFFLPFAAENQPQTYSSNFLIKLDNLELSAILALAENPEIEGKGLLYGELPIYVDEISNIIKAGWLKNKNPGTLQYRPNKESREMLKQNPQMKLLLDVLGHLNYQKLEATIELDDSGIMTLQGHTQGVNPDFKKGYPIIFNPRIELNIQDMITSLQISDEIGSRVSDRIQEKNLD